MELLPPSVRVARASMPAIADIDLEEITQDVAPEAVLDELEATEPGDEQH